jgi:hypothetical protein
MNIKKTLSALQIISDSPLLTGDVKGAVNSASWFLEATMTELGVAHNLTAPGLLDVIKQRAQPVSVDPSLGERYQALLHFVEKVAEVVDLAAECEVAGADQMKTLYRTLNLSVPSAVHPDAGLNAYLYSGRLYGADDDTAAIIYAANEDEAKIQFVEGSLGLFDNVEDDEDEEAEKSDDDDVRYYIITNDLIGVVDAQGRIVRR